MDSAFNELLIKGTERRPNEVRLFRRHNQHTFYLIVSFSVYAGCWVSPTSVELECNRLGPTCIACNLIVCSGFVDVDVGQAGSSFAPSAVTVAAITAAADPFVLFP